MSLGRAGRVEDDLDEARAVAQLDEDQLAQIAAAVDPARQHDLAGRRGVIGGDFAAAHGSLE